MRGLFTHLNKITSKYQGLKAADITSSHGIGEACYKAMRKLQKRVDHSGVKEEQSASELEDEEEADNVSSHTETPHLAGRPMGNSALLGTQQEGAAARNEFGADKQSATLRWLLSGTGQVRLAVDAARGGVHHVSMDVAAPSSASL